MKNIYLFVLVGVLISQIVQAQVVSRNERTGFWDQGSSWVGGVMPGTLSGGTLTLHSTDATINGTIKAVNHFALTGTLFSWSNMVVNAGDTLVILGNFSLGAFSSMTNNGVVAVMGNFSNNDGLNTINGSGKMVVTGNYSTTNVIGIGNTFFGPSYVYGSNSGFLVSPFSTQAALISGDPPLYAWVNYMYGVLPVQLVYFKGEAQNDGIVLSWQTASELNNDRFLVERSGDGIEFKTIAEVAGAGHSEVTLDYEYIDHAPMAGNSYYRLTQVDYDGTVSRFKVVAIKHTMERIEIYPNPTTDYLFFSNTREKYSVLADDMKGGKNSIQFQVVELFPGKLGIDVSLLEPGVYTLRVNDGNKTMDPVRFVKQ